MFYSTKEFQKYNLVKVLHKVLKEKYLPPYKIITSYTTVFCLGDKKRRRKRKLLYSKKSTFGEKYKIFAPIIGMSVIPCVYITHCKKKSSAKLSIFGMEKKASSLLVTFLS